MMEHRRLDRFALLSGLVFIVLGALFMLEALRIIEVPGSVVLPVLFVALGVGLLLGRRRSDPDAAPVDETVTSEAPPAEEPPPDVGAPDVPPPDVPPPDREG